MLIGGQIGGDYTNVERNIESAWTFPHIELSLDPFYFSRHFNPASCVEF
jgi:hypothetical protein